MSKITTFMALKSIIYIFFGVCLIYSCTQDKSPVKSKKNNVNLPINYDSIVCEENDTCLLEKKLIENGLVDIKTVVPDIFIDLRYSTSNNFMKMDLYGDLSRIYIQPKVAEKIKLAQSILKTMDSTLSLLVFDCVRPLSVQKQMWDTVKMPNWKKIKFLSNPALGSVHNYGAAVDISICTLDGKELDMGTPYDDTASLAYPTMENFYLANGKLTKQQLNNRQKLRAAMYKAGFFGIQTEWWHFNACTREAAMSLYKRID